MVAGVGGIHAGNAVQDGSHTLAAQHCAVGILDVPGQGRLAVAGVFRGAPDCKCRIHGTDAAVEGFPGGDGVHIQLICAVGGFLPVLGRVTVEHLFRERGRGKAHTEGQNQEQGEKPLHRMMRFHVNLILLYLFRILGMKKAPSEDGAVKSAASSVLRRNDQPMKQMPVQRLTCLLSAEYAVSLRIPPCLATMALPKGKS